MMIGFWNMKRVAGFGSTTMMLMASTGGMMLSASLIILQHDAIMSVMASMPSGVTTLVHKSRNLRHEDEVVVSDTGTCDMLLLTLASSWHADHTLNFTCATPSPSSHYTILVHHPTRHSSRRRLTSKSHCCHLKFTDLPTTIIIIIGGWWASSSNSS